MNRRYLVALALVAALALAGCFALPQGELGTENGYTYDQAIDVTFEDGLNESEREAVVGRAMARIERIRGLEFTTSTPVSVITREEFRNNTGGGSDQSGNLSDRQLWNEQVWEALHIVGEDDSYGSSSSTNRGASVVGYYSSSQNQIVIVSDSETPQIRRGTLVHELFHALQDQQLSLGESRDFQDGQLATRGVVEGEANYIEATYNQRCTGGTWDCIATPPRTGSGGPPDDFNQALFLVSYAPYAEGPWFIDAVRNRGGWDAVDDLYERFPESTEQVIHPGRYPDDTPESVALENRSTGGWERFTDIERPVKDTVGEASIYAMFSGNGVIDRSPTEQYNYSHPLSNGWTGDTLVPYRNDGEFGYAWRTAWDSAAEAEAFAEAYRDLLDSKDAVDMGDGRFRIPDGSFADAFRVTQSGSTVTIVNAPTPADLDAIHPPS